MTDMLERMNAVVLRGREKPHVFADEGARAWWTEHHRAALLAALDPEDEALVEAWAKAHWNGSPIQRMTSEPTTSTTRPYEWRGSPVLWDDDDMADADKETTRRGVRASIASLRAMAQGE